MAFIFGRCRLYVGAPPLRFGHLFLQRRLLAAPFLLPLKISAVHLYYRRHYIILPLRRSFSFALLSAAKIKPQTQQQKKEENNNGRGNRKITAAQEQESIRLLVFVVLFLGASACQRNRAALFFYWRRNKLFLFLLSFSFAIFAAPLRSALNFPNPLPETRHKNSCIFDIKTANRKYL